jgi:NADPH:quinone reductase-like Zn-dependent oxidoreductase
MRVVRLRAPGGPEQLAVEEADRPRPGPVEPGRRGKVVLAVT